MNQDFEEPDDWKGLAWDKVIEARNNERLKTLAECASALEKDPILGRAMGGLAANVVRSLASSPLSSNTRGRE